MEFLNVIENTLGRFADQGFIFWSATGAVALGVTLILAAGYIQFQRIRSKSRSPGITDLSEKPDPVALPPEASLEPILNEESQKPFVWLGEPTGEENSEELGFLLARLRKAADRLDAFQRTRGKHQEKSSESSLKETREGVDYLFRTGIG